MNLSVIIGSCDSYQELWKPFQICFDKYWKHKTENIFITETQDVPIYTNTNFKTIRAAGEFWGERMLQGIENSKNDYILFLLEDYFLDYYYSSDQVSNWIVDCEFHNINRLQISPSGYQIYKEIDGMKYHQIDKNYLISLQPSIWKKSFLTKTLFPNYSPWDYEIKGSLALKNKENSVFIDKSVPKVYFNAVRKGKKKSEGWHEFFEKEGLDDFDL
jgi:hypothetical protein